MNFLPVRSSYGGGNQWARQMVRALTINGYDVRFDLCREVDCILAMCHPSGGGRYTFGMDDICAYKKRRPRTACVFRVNDGDKTRGTNTFDRMFEHAQRCVDFTVFISKWLRDYHAARWFDVQRPHTVIFNGADPIVFHPFGGNAYEPSRPLRLVTHHWSDNWNKGFATYREIDQLIADKRLGDTELWIIGRWPKEITWRAAKTFGPAHGDGLARLLRQAHVYVTASKNEPGGMHHVEAAQCGLPILYHEDGGGIVEAACRYGVRFADDVAEAITEARTNYVALRRRVLEGSPSGSQMCLDYLRAIQHAIAERQTA